MKLIRTLPALALAAFIVATPLNQASAQATTKGGKTLLRFKWVKGKQYTYSSYIAMAAPGAKEPSRQSFAVTVSVLNAVKGTGTVKFQSSGEVQISDKPVTATVDSRGHTTSAGDFASFVIELPEKPVSVGQSWSYAQKTTTQFGSGTANLTLTFKGIKTVKKKQVAEITFKTSIKGNNLNGSGPGTIDLDVEDGMFLSLSQSLDMQIKSTSSSGKTSTLNLPVQLSMQRV